MAWLLDTMILSEGRRPRPEAKVSALLNPQSLHELSHSALHAVKICSAVRLIPVARFSETLIKHSNRMYL